MHFRGIQKNFFLSNQQKTVDFKIYFLIEFKLNEICEALVSILSLDIFEKFPDDLKKNYKTIKDKILYLYNIGIFIPYFHMDGRNCLEESKFKISESFENIEEELSLPKYKNKLTGRDILRGITDSNSFTMSDGIIENNSLKIINEKKINQGSLTSECWLIQMSGLTACNSCPVVNTEDCGGERIRKKLLNK
jgi:hypothetical protein